MNTIKNYKKKILLGTAQLYSDYGITNFNKLSYKKANNILDIAQREKILDLDTANLYNLSEKVIGEYSKFNGCKFNVYTKILPFHNNYSISKKKEIIYRSIDSSLKNLKDNNIKGIFVHKSSNFLTFKEEYLKIISEFFNLSNVFFGASIQNIDEYIHLNEYKEISIIQLPFNIIDSRWIKILRNKNKNNKLNIFVRSIYLQGLLLSKNYEWPNMSLKKVKKLSLTLNYLKNRFKFKLLIELYLSYVYSFYNIDKIIIGVANSNDLKTNLLNLSNIKIFDNNELDEIHESIPKVPLKLVNPTNWK